MGVGFAVVGSETPKCVFAPEFEALFKSTMYPPSMNCFSICLDFSLRAFHGLRKGLKKKLTDSKMLEKMAK